LKIKDNIGMILNSQPKQLTLKEGGQILWQADASNPLPGQPIATLRKGEKQLQPDFVLLDGAEPLKDQDPAAVIQFLKSWMEQHINTVLGPLTGLTKEEGIAGPAKDIAVLLHDALGIMPRQDLEPLIAGLDPEARKVLRQRHVRLGPVLVFVPELNKPAAVKLRATLWWLWNDRVLPAPLPKDGVVSVIVDEATIDPVYQRAIGYPVYGGRAIRVDMLDRLISAIYDSAKDGTFKATHAMAEWMGCSIPDLYKIIESMGHKKSHDPAEQPVVETAVVVAEVAVEAPVAETPAVEAEAPAVAAAPVMAVKPELATFRLKRGKANEAARPPRSENRAPRANQKSDHGSAVAKERDPSFKGKKKEDGFKGKPRGDKPRGRDGKPEKFEKKPTSFEARPKQMGDSPFAMLEQLKAGMKDK
jgi:ATP-dependent RNA helicase SUPV3L1/SUV3